MKTLLDWLKRILADALARTIAGLIAGVLLTVGYGAIAYSLSAFLSQQLSVSVLLIVILSLFALVGVLYPAARLWELVSASRRHTKSSKPRDEAVDSSAAQLRRLLAQIEAGPNLTYEKEVKKFSADLLTAFDDWETALLRYLSPSQAEEVKALRLEIAGRSVLHSRHEARGWLRRVKDLTSVAAPEGR